MRERARSSSGSRARSSLDADVHASGVPRAGDGGGGAGLPPPGARRRLPGRDAGRRRARGGAAGAGRRRRGWSAVDRDPDALREAGQRLAPLRRAGAAGARELRRRAGGGGGGAGGRWRGCCWTWASPRTRSTRRSAASPSAPGRRWTCAWGRRAAGEATAAELLNDAPRARSWRTSSTSYGEERRSRRLARVVVEMRGARAARHQRRAGGGHRAGASRAPTPQDQARIFQALRIAVNGELEALERGAGALPRRAGAGRGDRRARLPLPGGPAGEGRLPRVEPRLRLPARPAGLPLPRARRWGRRSRASRVFAGEAEVAGNPRARSARLRAWRKA